MNDDISDIIDFYNNSIDREEKRLQEHQLERDLTWRYFEEYLPIDGQILEIGAATGNHTVWLATHGYQVVAVDFAENLLDRCKKRVAEIGFSKNVDFRLADARHLNSIEDDLFDAVMLMGPLYHLVLAAERMQALEQAVGKLKLGGLFFSSHISRLGILGDLMRQMPEWIEEEDEVYSILTHGRDPVDYPKGGFRGYFATSKEIPTIHEDAGLQTLVLAGIEPAISADDESYNKLEGKQRKMWLDLLYKISQEPSIVASSRHLLYIGRKFTG
jgi:S-adenosylmethionine-dependent methyltransferase